MYTEMVVLEEYREGSETKSVRRWGKPAETIQRIRHAGIWNRAWLGWAFVYTVVLLLFSIYRLAALHELIMMYGTRKDCTAGVEAGALGLGFLEDFRTVSDWVAHRSDRSEEAGDKWTRQAVWIVEGVATFLVSWLLFIAMMGPFVADLLLVRLRDMRFTFELVAMAIHEKDNAGAAAISESELTQGYLNVTALVIVATFFATVRTWSRAGRKTKYDDRAPDNVDKDSNEVILELASTGPRLNREMVFRLCILVAILLVILVALGVTTQGFTPLIADGSIESAQVYIHSATEEYTLFQDDALYRRTTGFRGDLAFDVNISDDNPPNVLLIVVESFRFHDSHYLVGDEDPSNLFKGTNITITPNFDKWAKRGWSRDEMMELAESDLGITSDEWYGDDNRGFDWGVHDDLNFQLLGDLLVNKTTEQNSRIEHGEAKKPVFLTHYTISSHTPFKARPKWYADADKPDFSALYEGEEYADFIKDYLEMRYFTDMQLGKFLDRMADENVLNDTIIVIVGTIIAEGRLGDAAGLNIEDAVEQYDILNTLADITGVPDGGFLQDGIGRSLKRNDTFGERVVYSNNPSRKMSVVRGHDRLRYDRYSNSVLLHNADTDHDMDIDLFPNLNRTEKMDWNVWRDNGRRLNAYYTKRWIRSACWLENAKEMM
ncbi:hypothetical protein BBJ29_003519 [Phytophthora kernoviae]|uniref:Sulfatase N-terminal domain-containing protein n=1 Tax=Phytophthora kernoviae TaxID=325452 RepID=A0A3F2RLL5_9STRA|nr:hypothetical protein BBJ29_003519 [Phytophthora kernoviae]RLN59855.1 hypothetical protein BBP00_00006288 [Phytophthora kernoviae]